VAPDGIVIGVDHIQELVDLAINNMKKSKDGQALLESKRVQFIKGDGRLGYKEGGTVLDFPNSKDIYIILS
jgi:protein-L-isoaspartate(D-aspartate) O-methyltransferase